VQLLGGLLVQLDGQLDGAVDLKGGWRERDGEKKSGE